MKKLNIVAYIMLTLTVISCSKELDGEVKESNSQEIAKSFVQDTIAMHKEYQAFLAKNPSIFKDNPNNTAPNSNANRIGVDPEIFNIINILGSYALGQTFTAPYNILFQAKTPGDKAYEYNIDFASLLLAIENLPYITTLEGANGNLRTAEVYLQNQDYASAKSKLNEVLGAYATADGIAYSPTNVLMALTMLDVCSIKLSATRTTIAAKQSEMTSSKDWYRKFLNIYVTKIQLSEQNISTPNFNYKPNTNFTKAIKLANIQQSYFENVLTYNSRIWTRAANGLPRAIGSAGSLKYLKISYDGYIVAPGHPKFSSNSNGNYMTFRTNGKYHSITAYVQSTQRFLAPWAVSWNNNVNTVHGEPSATNAVNNLFIWTFCPVDGDAFYITTINGSSWNWGYNGINLVSVTKLSTEFVTSTAKISFN
jgi:hypothetical protein